MRPILLMASVMTLLVAACGGGEEPATQTAAQATSALAAAPGEQATPTLLPPLATSEALGNPTAAPTNTVTPSPTPSPTATPLPTERLAQAEVDLRHEDFEGAVEQYAATLSEADALSEAQYEEALWGVAIARWRDGETLEAASAFQQYLSATGGSDNGESDSNGPDPEHGRRARALFHLGQIFQASGECEQAVEAFKSYLALHPDMAAYVEPRVGACYLELGQDEQALRAYEEAAKAPAQRLHVVENRLRLAASYLALEQYGAAVEQYDAVHAIAKTENTRGEMMYLAGKALITAGDEEAGYARYLEAVNRYPQAYDSYQGLVELLDAGYAVDPYQRGVVDYYAAAYVPAVAAFEMHLAADTEERGKQDAYLYLAWSLEKLGDVEGAFAALEAYAGNGETAAEAGLERGKLFARTGDSEQATQAYLAVATNHPESKEAPEALWLAARLADLEERTLQAGEYYRQLAEQYPDYEEAAWALFRAGWLAQQSDGAMAGVPDWQQVVERYPESEWQAAALIWLMRTVPDENVASLIVTATQLTGDGYYAIRAREVARGGVPFAPPDELALGADEAAERQEAERWLGAQVVEAPTEAVSSTLPAALQADGRLARGEKLWQLGLYEAARAELEDLRIALADDAVASYQLSLRFRDLGLYRSSILAAATVLRLSGTSVFDAPRLIGRLAYPVYYHELVLPLAEAYGYDPLLQFALVRQESLFESFIASYAGAQGLSQVIPDTGAYIARKLDWPDFANEDLYRPYVGLEFGAFYLAEQLELFDGSPFVALSAYNGGPGNAMRWLDAAGHDLDLYLESVDFRETREYIRRIYSGHAVYRHLYGEG